MQTSFSSPSCSDDGWIVTNSTTALSSYICPSCTGYYALINSDESSSVSKTLEWSLHFSPATNNISVSFDYKYKDFSSANNDKFDVYIWDVNANSKLNGSSLLVSAGSTIDGSFIQNNIAVVPAQPYILKFEYYGDYDYGATVDNVVVSESAPSVPGSYVLRLEDGTEGVGKVLTSDADGNAYWSNASGLAPQNLSISGNSLSIPAVIRLLCQVVVVAGDHIHLIMV